MPTGGSVLSDRDVCVNVKGEGRPTRYKDGMREEQCERSRCEKRVRDEFLELEELRKGLGQVGLLVRKKTLGSKYRRT